MTSIPVKMPAKTEYDVLDYGFDYSLWIREGDTLITSSWILPDALTEESSDLDASTAIVKVVISGGVAGETYTVTNRVTTDLGLHREVSFRLRVV